MGNRPYCRCDKTEDARAVENWLEDNIGAEWKGSKRHRSITDALADVLDEFYSYTTCRDCRDTPDASD